MLSIPTPVIKFGHKAGTWLIKNSPKLMSIGGGIMAVGGAVMACNATLHADEVLEAHKERMAQIEAARALSLEGNNDDPACVYTEKQMKHDKFVVYAETAVGFARLYAPAFVIGMSGVGLMQAAYMITEQRRNTAIAALASLDAMFNEYKVRVENEVGPDKLAEIEAMPTEKHKVLMPGSEEESEEDCVVLDDAICDDFTFIFDETCKGWQGGLGYNLNYRALECIIEGFNRNLSAYNVDHYVMNDLLKAYKGLKNVHGQHVCYTEPGLYYGWNALEGDVINYEITPYLIMYNGDDDKQIPMYVETSMEEIKKLECTDIQTGYCFFLRFYTSNADVVDEVGLKAAPKYGPRMIYHEIYG